MKKLREILKQKHIFLDDFESKDDVFAQFRVDESKQVGVNILFAYYLYEDYSGSAYVIFEKEGKLYDVDGSHCSCMGLEDQWDPNPTDLDVIQNTILKGNSYSMNQYGEQLKKFLGIQEPIEGEVTK